MIHTTAIMDSPLLPWVKAVFVKQSNTCSDFCFLSVPLKSNDKGKQA